MNTIVAISTPPGVGGIAVVRLSGPDAFAIADKIWQGTPLSNASSHTAHLGIITDSDGDMLDQVVATVFAENRSFTGEPTVEFSVHGSRWIQRRVVERLIEAGASAAGAGEFTQRAFLNGRLDLAQAEAVADMIAASSKASQRLAATQMKGNFSRRLNQLRDSMIDIASLLELELDFSEEDVEFADRSRLLEMTRSTRDEIARLADSFHAGRALKEGVAVVIAGKPNAGKSTLLNHLLQDDKAIVSDIAGTTRDIIEDTTEINGILFRFIDTAGIRESDDHIERIGVDRARQALTKADILLWLTDPNDPTELPADIPEGLPTLILETKADCNEPAKQVKSAGASEQAKSAEAAIPTSSSNPEKHPEIIKISAKTGFGIPILLKRLTEIAESGTDTSTELIVTNARHYESLMRAIESLKRVEQSLTEGLPADLTAQDLREAIHHLGTITGAITPADLLQTIFSRFCIGK